MTRLRGRWTLIDHVCQSPNGSLRYVITLTTATRRMPNRLCRFSGNTGVGAVFFPRDLLDWSSELSFLGANPYFEGRRHADSDRIPSRTFPCPGSIQTSVPRSFCDRAKSSKIKSARRSPLLHSPLARKAGDCSCRPGLLVMTIAVRRTMGWCSCRQRSSRAIRLIEPAPARMWNTLSRPPPLRVYYGGWRTRARRG